MHDLNFDNLLSKCYQEFNLYLASNNERFFASKNIINHENFSVPTLLGVQDTDFLIMNPFHHFNRAGRIAPTQFIYSFKENLFMTLNNSFAVFGSMSTYCDAKVIVSNSIHETFFDIFKLSILPLEESRQIIALIKKGSRFQVAVRYGRDCIYRANIDLPMLLDNGEFVLNMPPFFGCKEMIASSRIFKSGLKSHVLLSDNINTGGDPSILLSHNLCLYDDVLNLSCEEYSAFMERNGFPMVFAISNDSHNLSQPFKPILICPSFNDNFSVIKFSGFDVNLHAKLFEMEYRINSILLFPSLSLFL